MKQVVVPFLFFFYTSLPPQKNQKKQLLVITLIREVMFVCLLISNKTERIIGVFYEISVGPETIY